MPGRIDLDVQLGNPAGPRRLRPATDRFRILVLGDLGGRGGRPGGVADDLASRPIRRLDVDSFDAVLRRIAPRVTLPRGGDSPPGDDAEIRFERLEDFHPDRLFASLASCGALRDTRRRLLDPATFEREAAGLLGEAPAGNAPPGAAEPAAGLFERLIGGTTERAAAPTPAATAPVAELVRRLVRPHVSPVTTESPAPFVAAIDRSATELMRAILHDPRFQALESAWRGIRRLVDGLDLDEDLQLHVVDVERAELAADAARSRGEPSSSALRRLVSGPTGPRPGDEPWSLLVGLYAFGPSLADLELLAHLGGIAVGCGAQFFAAAEPGLLGCRRLDERADPRDWALEDPEFECRWNDLRRSPAARHVSLALPRVLLRRPYGADSDPVDAFAFEELSPAGGHDEYLWGNPALVCAEVAARACRGEGVESPVAPPLDVDDLPACVRERDGERQLVPCGEYFLSLALGEEILRRGLIPILSYADRNAVRVGGLRSIAD